MAKIENIFSSYVDDLKKAVEAEDADEIQAVVNFIQRELDDMETVVAK